MSKFDKIIDRNQYHSIKFKGLSRDYFTMGTADMDFESALPIKEALIQKAQQGIYGYEFKPDSYYNSIINWYQRHYQWTITKDEIAVVPGVWTSMRLCVDTFSEVGDHILVHWPAFFPIVDVIKGSGRKVVFNELIYQDNYYTIDFEKFEKQLQENNIKLFILISPHNPSGRVFTSEELTKIGQLCQKYQVMVISDEVHGSIVFAGCQHLPFSSIKEFANNSLVINAASKAYNLQGLTHGYVIIPNPVYRESFENTLKGYDFDFAMNIFSMAALEAAYNHCDEWLSEVTDYLANNLNYLADYLKKEIPQLKLIRPQAAYMAWIDVSSLNLTNDELKELFYEKGKMYFSFEENFSMNEGKFLRLNYGCPLSVLKEALKRMRELVSDFE